MAEIDTVKGLRAVRLITEDLISKWLPNDNPEMAQKRLKAGDGRMSPLMDLLD